MRDCIVEDGCEGIGYKIVSSTYEKNNISIRVKWTNKRKEDLYFGEEFKLFKTDGDAACTQKKATGFAAVGNIISPGGSKTEIYNLSAYYDIEPGVQYRLEKTFYLKSANDKKYKAYIVFKAGDALAEYMPEKAHILSLRPTIRIIIFRNSKWIISVFHCLKKSLPRPNGKKSTNFNQ